MHSKDRPRALVMGLDHTALATIRSLARRGVKVIATARADGGGVAACTTRARKVACEAYLGDAFINLLKEIAADCDDLPVLIPTADDAVLYVSRHRDKLQDDFRFVLPAEMVVETLMDKKAFAHWAMENNVSVPRTVSFQSLEEGLVAAEDLRFPAVFKPAVKDTDWLGQSSVPKAMQIDDREALENAYKSCHGYTDCFILQEVIPGGDHLVKFCLVYFSADGEVLATYEGEKIRQYPQFYGSTSLAVGRPVSEVTEITVEILKKAGFCGIGSVEFKQDPRDGQLCVTEPTVGRPDLQSGLAAGAGVDISYIAYCDAAGLEVPEMTLRHHGHKWLFERNDLASALRYIRDGDLRLRDWLRSLSGSRTCATFALDDPLPFACLTLGLGARMLGIRTRWW